MSYFRCLPHLCASLLLLIGTVAGATDFHSPRTAALGGAGHAGPLLNDAIFLNPSFASFLPTYSVAGNYPAGRGFGVSILDGRTELFQAGVAYTVLDRGRFIHVGASKGAIKRLGFGLGAKFFMPEGSDQVVRDGTLSFTGIALDWLQGALIVDNLLETDEGREFLLYREVILGMKANLRGIALVYFDPHWIPALDDTGSPYGYESGLEFVLMRDLFFRLGMFRNSKVPYRDEYGRGYGIGIGWVAPRISMDYGVSRVLRPNNETVHVGGMTIYF